MLSITAHGWTYTVMLTLMTGVLAHGLMVFAQSTIPIGSIGIAQIAQPRLPRCGPSCCSARHCAAGR